MRILPAVLFVIVSAGVVSAQDGMAKRKLQPYEYGMVVIDNFSSKAGITPAVFDHWSHRSRFTCRVCHIDVGFSMKKNASGITATDNKKGLFCGACHNGTRVFGSDKIFQACTTEFTDSDVKRCERCHQKGRTNRKQQFAAFAQNLPKGRFGNTINWEKAEEMQLIKPSDVLEGVSLKMDQLPVQKDFALVSKNKVGGMPDIIFSHQKHTFWNGCEVCHPDFFAIKKGTTPYSMTAMFEGKYCGVCHDTVAFPQTDCQRCHTKQV